ncbi:MAG: hypothetical protein P1P64_06465 [Treponemataceae bacterium]
MNESLKKGYEETRKNNPDEDNNLGISSSFSVYQDEKILSIYLVSNNIWISVLPNHKVYNFSLPDGNLISDDKLLEHFGVKKEDILNLMEDSIIKKHETFKASQRINTFENPFGFIIGNYDGLALNDLWDNYNSSENNFFINEVREPMFLYDYSTYAGADVYTAVQELESRSSNTPIFSPIFENGKRAGYCPL